MEHKHCHNEHCNCNHSHEDVKAQIHDGAIVISVDREIQGSLTVIKNKIEKELKNFGEWVEDKDGIVGHVKAYINSEGLGYMLSFTVGEVQCKEVPPVKVQVSLVAIVFNLELHEVECRFTKIFEAI